MIEERSLLINYSHSHEDYRRSDVRFNGQADVELVAPNSAGLYAFLDKADRTRSDRSIEPGEL